MKDIVADAWLFQFESHMSTYYPLVMDLLSRQQAPEMRLAIRDWLARVGVEKGLMREGRYAGV